MFSPSRESRISRIHRVFTQLAVVSIPSGVSRIICSPASRKTPNKKVSGGSSPAGHLSGTGPRGSGTGRRTSPGHGPAAPCQLPPPHPPPPPHDEPPPHEEWPPPHECPRSDHRSDHPSDHRSGCCCHRRRRSHRRCHRPPTSCRPRRCHRPHPGARSVRATSFCSRPPSRARRSVRSPPPRSPLRQKSPPTSRPSVPPKEVLRFRLLGPLLA